ncbi:hypothetical protein MGAST_05265 [Mycobacterium gastri 'Wayne']|nr:hypothetical protein MGAST_05265 [Mycobacterium gastri 'Wayne']
MKGCDWASLNRAQPLATSITAHNAVSAHRTDRRIRMTDRLRTSAALPPPATATCHRRLAAPAWQGKSVMVGLPEPDLGRPAGLVAHEVPTQQAKAPLKSQIQD